MLSKAQEKLIKSLHTKKGREKSGLCLVEGAKVIETAGKAIEYTFTKKDTDNFENLITTETPQEIAGVAKKPQWTMQDLLEKKQLIILDGLQDPGNLGAIFRLCLAFNAALILINSVDPTNSKVIRSSVGALFSIPYKKMDEEEAKNLLKTQKKPIYRLEKTDKAVPITQIEKTNAILIAGSEGSGIQSSIEGKSIFIEHNPLLDSLNVTHALAIALHHIS